MPEISISEGIAYIKSEQLHICMPVSRLRATAERSKRLLAEWDAEQRGTVVPFASCMPPGH